MTTPATRSDFRYAGGFSNNGPTRKWFQRLNYDLEPLEVDREIQSDKHLEAIDLMLEGDADAWADSNEQIQKAFSGPNEENRDFVIKLLELRYPGLKPMVKETVIMEDCLRSLS